MSMFNDISCKSKENEQECELSVILVSVDARRFSPGRWSFLGPGSEKKWYSVSANSPQGEWDKIAELMMLKFGESGHQFFDFRYTIALTLRSLKLFFRTIISVNQLSFCGSVAEICEEYESYHHRMGRSVLRGQCSPAFVPSVKMPPNQIDSSIK